MLPWVLEEASVVVLVLTMHMEVRLPILGRFLVRLVISGPLRHVDGFGWQLLWRAVAAFSTFSFVVVVLEVQCELAVCD